ncbi:MULTISPECIES: EAL domain-containing protein [unclassified Fusibacter]|uniref:bifunctional diguanylate cyclase/phosphodiesterase n=1 Tax=unclassified Fusibacter TaxID=2624464 RepID=UPI0013E92BB7|nr:MULTISPECIES: EAL domain-containing protein [unclassified Fusibacter]MCK8059345.1 EAL domain-containing protein [Fusibacter sp. A2]NPE21191.1 EAL domain-containing protein [Fusibacter sp. A1]
MKFFSIRKKIEFSLVALVLVVFIIMGLQTYWFTKNELETRYLNEMNEIMDAANYLLEDIISDSSNAINVVEAQFKDSFLSKDGLSAGKIDEQLKVIKLGVVEATTLYFGTEKGDFYLEPKRFVEEGYDPRLRDWYLLAKKNPSVIEWTQPYVDMGTESLVISGSKYISIGSFSGVIGIDVLLENIETTINNINIGDSGEIMLVNGSDTIIVGKEFPLVSMKVGELAPGLADLADGDRLDDGTYTYFKRNIEDSTNYFLGRVLNSEIQKSASKLLNYSLILGLVVIVLAIVIAGRIAGHLTKPIFQLAETMKTTVNGDYRVRCEVSNNDEVGLLVDGFNEMIGNIHEKNEEMTALYEELYASEEALKEQYDELFFNREMIKESEALYKQIFDASKEGLWILNKDVTMEFVTKDWYRQFEIDLESSTLNEWKLLIHPEDKELVDETVGAHILNNTEQYMCEFRVLNRSGEYRWVQGVGKASFDEEGNWIRIVGSHVDITKRKESAQHIKNLAYRDALTGLGNRVTLHEVLTSEFDSGSEGAIFYIDIDNFKYINDTYGHTLGDVVLIELADRLRSLAVNDLQIARISGDEFVVVLKGITERRALIDQVKELLRVITEQVVIEDRILKVSASIGITIYPSDAKDLTSLLRNADLAMYSAKERTDRDFIFYDETIKSEMLERIHMENYLKSALDYDEIFVVFQPIVSVPDQTIVGFESLIRWRHPEIGLISPVQFIPIAEKTGLINTIGLYVLESSIKQIKKINSGSEVKRHISVNISVVQLLNNQFVEKVVNLLKTYDLPAQELTLEVTESLALEHDSQIIEKLVTLRELGIGISLDDFGSGYSSINNLLNLPITTLKVDRNLVQKTNGQHVNALVEAVVSYCHQTGIYVVAEGVEDSMQLNAMIKLGCDNIQGYYYSKPIEISDIQRTLENWPHEPIA